MKRRQLAAGEPIFSQSYKPYDLFGAALTQKSVKSLFFR